MGGMVEGKQTKTTWYLTWKLGISLEETDTSLNYFFHEMREANPFE